MSDQGGLDFSALLQQAQAMQEQMMAAQTAQAEQTVAGQSGGGKVIIEMTGDGRFRSVTIAPDVVDPSDVELLEDLVLAALRDAGARVIELQQGGLGGIDLGHLGGLLGGQ
ncbi:MAG: YbaB/EbfC family nucleoid-associated protein [Actinomycetota bacterium]|nr:YbaB/EbfC family nucleoid-associated protein [Actinomycetota bacterium]